VTAVADGRGLRAAVDHSHPDLVILDLTVRGGMGGVEALARLRECEPRVVAIATTGYSEETLGEDLRASGFVRVLPKPFLMHELVGTITAVLAPA